MGRHLMTEKKSQAGNTPGGVSVRTLSLSQLISCRQETQCEEKVLGTCETQRTKEKKIPSVSQREKMCILLDLTHILTPHAAAHRTREWVLTC